MLLNLHKKNWTEGLKLKNWEEMKTTNEESIKVRSSPRTDMMCTARADVTNLLDALPSAQRMLHLSQTYTASVKEESSLTAEQLKTRHVGKQDPKRHLEEAVERAMGDSILQSLGTMLTVLSSGSGV